MGGRPKRLNGTPSGPLLVAVTSRSGRCVSPGRGRRCNRGWSGLTPHPAHGVGTELAHAAPSHRRVASSKAGRDPPLLVAMATPPRRGEGGPSGARTPRPPAVTLVSPLASQGVSSSAPGPSSWSSDSAPQSTALTTTSPEGGFMRAKPIPEGYEGLIPSFVVDDATEAVEFVGCSSTSRMWTRPFSGPSTRARP